MGEIEDCREAIKKWVSEHLTVTALLVVAVAAITIIGGSYKLVYPICEHAYYAVSLSSILAQVFLFFL